MDEIKEIRNHFKDNLNILSIKVTNGEKIVKKHIMYNFLGMLISNITVASFLLWNNKENINYYLVDNDYMCFFINETFYKIKIKVIDDHTLNYKNKNYEFINK